MLRKLAEVERPAGPLPEGNLTQMTDDIREHGIYVRFDLPNEVQYLSLRPA